MIALFVLKTPGPAAAANNYTVTEVNSLMLKLKQTQTDNQGKEIGVAAVADIFSVVFTGFYLPRRLNNQIRFILTVLCFP